MSIRCYVDATLKAAASGADGDRQVKRKHHLAQGQWGVSIWAKATRHKSYCNWICFNESSSCNRLTSPSSDPSLWWGIFLSAAHWLITLCDSVQMMGIWVTLSSWHAYRLKKYLAGKNMQWEWSHTMCWQQNCPEKLNALPFPSPSVSPLCRSSRHTSFLFVPAPCGAMTQIRPLLGSTLKITLPEATPLLEPTDCVFALGSFDTVLCTERGKKLCQVPLSQALKNTGDWWTTELKPSRLNRSHAAELSKSTSRLNTSSGNSCLVLQ